MRSKPYARTLIMHEEEEVVTSIKSHDYPSSEGGREQGVALVMLKYMTFAF